MRRRHAPDCHRKRLLMSLFGIAAAYLTLLPNSTSAYSYKLLYSFCSRTNWTDGSGPQYALAREPGQSLRHDRQ